MCFLSFNPYMSAVSLTSTTHRMDTYVVVLYAAALGLILGPLAGGICFRLNNILAGHEAWRLVRFFFVIFDL